MGLETPRLQEICWENIRDDIKSINPKLYHIIDKINPNKNYPLFKATYAYGDEIINKGHLYLPHEKLLYPLNASQFSSRIKELLGYNLGTNPVSLVLKNSIEIFTAIENRTVSLYGLVTPGKVFSTSRILSQTVSYSPPFLWDMTAGARSIFMLPKISDAYSNEKLRKEFGMSIIPPKGLHDHWKIFKELAQHEKFESPWFAEMLFFSKKWFTHLNDPAWKDFHLYLFQSAWNNTEFWRNQFVWDLVFCLVKKNINIRPNPYIADTVKHLLSIAAGATSGFAPAIDDSSCPCKKLQEIYSTVYSLKDYQPIIMEPYTLALYQQSRPVYYSLEYPNTMEFSPKSKKISNKITDLIEIKYLLDKYFAEICKGQLNIQGTPFQDLINGVVFDYFHANLDAYDGIKESSEMPKGDPNLKSIYASNKNKSFPKNSTFLRGCIRISKAS